MLLRIGKQRRKQLTRRKKMIFKVLFQEHAEEAPVREETQTMYIEAGSVKKVREKLADRNINIEHILELNEAHLAYEQKSEDFKVENI